MKFPRIAEDKSQLVQFAASSESAAESLEADVEDLKKGVSYITVAPTEANTNGHLIFVVLEEEPSTYYDGYYYIILEPQQ